MTTAHMPRDHGALMDSVYRGQRHIYDATRKYFLFGRDRLISDLACQTGQTVLELACGTGRNLRAIDRKWPGCRLFGLDISSEMLKSAEARLHGKAMLRLGDATGFDPVALFGEQQFDRIVLSYCLSMIPEWQGALRQALDLLAPGGSLHVVDFGEARGLPRLARMALLQWLSSFHVNPRNSLPVVATSLAAKRRWKVRTRSGPLAYYSLIRIERKG